jgi:hypothetical protein
MNEQENCPVGIPPESALSASTGADDGSDDVPTDEPPASDSATTTTDAFGAATWHADKKVQALFGTKANRNSWIYPTGLGWKKLADNSDSASVALTILGSHARQLDRNVKIKEDGGKITEMYVW